jgi:hypothetical protein
VSASTHQRLSVGRLASSGPNCAKLIDKGSQVAHRYPTTAAKAHRLQAAGINVAVQMGPSDCQTSCRLLNGDKKLNARQFK